MAKAANRRNELMEEIKQKKELRNANALANQNPMFGRSIMK